jgi:hypothetical protein
MSDSVFLCYARLDQDRVLQLAEALRERGVPVWIDRWNIPAGANWMEAIDDAIRACTRFLVVLSPAAAASEQVEGELHGALKLRKDVVPVLLERCEIPRRILEIEYFDISDGLTGPESDRLAALLRGGHSQAPPSRRLQFLHALRDVPESAPSFDDEFTKTAALEISRRLTDGQFDALSALGAGWSRYDRGARGIVRSLVLQRIGGPAWDAGRTLDVLQQFGFLAPSRDSRQRNHSDPAYDYTPLFFGYTQLLRDLESTAGT